MTPKQAARAYFRLVAPLHAQYDQAEWADHQIDAGEWSAAVISTALEKEETRLQELVSRRTGVPLDKLQYAIQDIIHHSWWL